MTDEETIQAELVARFPFMRDKVRVQRPRRVWAEVGQDHFAEVFGCLAREMRFTMLSAITGLDQGETLGLIYHLARENGLVLSLATGVPKAQPVVQTVTPLFACADVYEREVADLLGFQVQGLPQGPRYPLPDGWPAGQYPLRKDWKPESLGDAKAEKGGPTSG